MGALIEGRGEIGEVHGIRVTVPLDEKVSRLSSFSFGKYVPK